MFDAAEDAMHENDTTSLFAKGGEGALAMMTNDRVFAYDGGGQDRIFTCLYKAIDYMTSGNNDAARTELNRAGQHQEKEVDQQQRGHAAGELDHRHGQPAQHAVSAQLAPHHHKAQRDGDHCRRQCRLQRGEQALPQKAPGGPLPEEIPVSRLQLAGEVKLVEDEIDKVTQADQRHDRKRRHAPPRAGTRRLIQPVPNGDFLHRSILTFLSIIAPAQPIRSAVAT